MLPKRVPKRRKVSWLFLKNPADDHNLAVGVCGGDSTTVACFSNLGLRMSSSVRLPFSAEPISESWRKMLDLRLPPPLLFLRGLRGEYEKEAVGLKNWAIDDDEEDAAAVAPRDGCVGLSGFSAIVFFAIGNYGGSLFLR